MSAHPDISTRYLRIATQHHRSWARQIGAFRGGHIIVFALVGADGRDLGKVLIADDIGVELEPAVLQPDGLHLARAGMNGASAAATGFSIGRDPARGEPLDRAQAAGR